MSRTGEIYRDLAFLGGLLRGTPFSLLLQVTNRCNMHCSFCDFWPNPAPPREELTLLEFERLEEELFRLGRFLISIEGGEPLLRPDLVDIVRVLSRRHLTVLYTNGWHITPEKARALFAAGLTQAGVSIDYPDARHDRKRGLPGALQRAWNAVRACRDAAPHQGRQVHVITVLTRDNQADLDGLLQQSACEDVGHIITLLSTTGFRRGKSEDHLPDAPISRHLLELRERHGHFRIWRDYLDHMDRFLASRADPPAESGLPRCRAGLQSFNIDHRGNVSACIETIDHPVGNLRDESLEVLHARLVSDRDRVSGCQDCWTLCRGNSQLLGGGSSLRVLHELATRMRSS